MIEPAPLLLLDDPLYLSHEPGGGHPESSGRLRAIQARLAASPIAGARAVIPAPAPREAIARVHSPGHLDALDALRGEARWVTPDTGVSAGSVPAIESAAGAAIAAVDAVVKGEARRAFALVRPPGHHAKRDRMMGFCFVNNIAVAAAHARAVHGLTRVLIVDWDVHHGNGTESIFFTDPGVLVFDSHQSPLYPGTGELDSAGAGEGRGYTVNLPLPAETGDGDLLGLYRELLTPIAEAFRPELILVSAGFDGHRDDPLGGFALTDEGFAGLCGLVTALADRLCGGRLCLFLEGGYDHDALARSVHACGEVLVGRAPPPAPAMSARGEGLLKIFREFHRRRWPTLG
ncbi:MAG: histone deacetylase [Nannocystaceae bacterium]